MEPRDLRPGGQGKPPKPSLKWSPMIFYLLAMFGFLWIWQSAVSRNLYREIPYSQFKDYLRSGRVTNAVIQPTTILGEIEETNPPATTNKSVETNAAAKTHAPGKPEEFGFRTVRVDDPDLVNQLQAAHVNFSGVQPSGISALFFAWVVPIGLMVLVWIFISRRLRGAGESLLSF